MTRKFYRDLTEAPAVFHGAAVFPTSASLVFSLSLPPPTTHIACSPMTRASHAEEGYYTRVLETCHLLSRHRILRTISTHPH
jgi:hypothetical protein